MSSSRSSAKLSRTDPEFWMVVMELPDPLPVTDAEIDVIERFFGALLDEVIHPMDRVSDLKGRQIDDKRP